MDTKSSKCVHLVEGGTDGSQDVNMAPMGKTSLRRVIHARKRQKTSFTNLETQGDGSGYLACDTCSSGVPNEIVPAGIVPIGNIPVGNNIGFQTRTKGFLCASPTPSPSVSRPPSLFVSLSLSLCVSRPLSPSSPSLFLPLLTLPRGFSRVPTHGDPRRIIKRQIRAN